MGFDEALKNLVNEYKKVTCPLNKYRLEEILQALKDSHEPHPQDFEDALSFVLQTTRLLQSQKNGVGNVRFTKM